MTPTKRTLRPATKTCPVCGDYHDGYWYEPDEEQVLWDYPERFRMCKACEYPLLGVGLAGLLELYKEPRR